MSSIRSWCGLGGLAIAFFSVLLVFPGSQASAAKARSSGPPASLWGVEVDNSSFRLLDKAVLKRLRDSRATLVASPGRLTSARRSKLQRLARRNKLAYFAPGRVRRASAVTAASSSVVVVRTRSAEAFQRLASSNSTMRVAGIVDLSLRSYDEAAWQSAIAAADSSETLDLIVRPRGSGARRAVERYLTDVSTTLSPDPAVTSPFEPVSLEPAFALLAGSPRGDSKPPSQPGGLRTTSVWQTSVSLAWDASTDNRGVAAYDVFRDGAYVTSTTKDQRSATVSSLTCGAAYDLGVAARDAAGNTSTRAILRVTTSACPDSTPPSVPLGMVFTGATQTTVTVGWNASTDNVGVAGYRMYRDGQQVATTQSNSYTFSGLACGRSYEFSITAYDAAGNESNRAEAAGTRASSACDPAPDAQAPSAPSNLAHSSATATSVTLTWSASSDDVGVTEYRVYRDGTLVASPTATSQSVTGLACGTSYVFGVEASDAAGNTSSRATLTASTEACADTQAPTAPTNLSRSGGSATSVTVSWSPSTDNVGVTGYRAYRDGTLVASPTGTSQSVTGLACGTSYVFGVEARDAAGNTSPRATLTASTDACATADTEAPSPPTGMAFGTTTQTSVAMTWSAATDNVGVAGYHLYRNGTRVASTTNHSYTFTELTCGTAYTLAIESYDAAGNTSNRAEASGNATTQACDQSDPAPDPGGGTASVFVATNGSDGNPCTSSAPCASFDRANRVASPGNIVQVAAGTYPAQRMTAVSGRTGPNVVLQPASGARVILGGLTFGQNGDSATGPDYITVKNMETTYKTAEPGAGNQRSIFIGPGSTNIRLENMDAGSVDTWFADGVTIKGGDYGPCDAVWGSNVCGNNKFDVSSNVLVDGATFHDLRFDETCFTVSGADCHWECMYINSSNNFTVRNSKFRGCAIFDIFATISGPDAARVGHRNLRIENNWFAAPWTEGPNNSGTPSRSTAVALAWCGNSSLGYRDVTIGFNSFQRNANLYVDRQPGCTFQNTRVVGNLMMRGRCESDFSYAYNVYTTVSSGYLCSSSDQLIGDTIPYVNGTSQTSAIDYHLASASMADKYVPSSAGCPATDVDGTARGAPCTAGSHER